MVREGFAEDITRYSFGEMRDFLHARSLDRVAIGRGVYGMNCGLLKDIETGEHFAIICRNSALFMAF